jgi:hypothetical protein
MNTIPLRVNDWALMMRGNTKKLFVLFLSLFTLEIVILMGFNISPSDTLEDAQVKTLIMSLISWIQITAMMTLMLTVLRKEVLDVGLKFKFGASSFCIVLAFLLGMMFFLIMLMFTLSFIDTSALSSLFKGQTVDNAASLQSTMLGVVFAFFISALYFGTLLQQLFLSQVLKIAKQKDSKLYVRPVFAPLLSFTQLHKQWKFFLLFIGSMLLKSTAGLADAEGYIMVGALISSAGSVLVVALITSLVVAGISATRGV